MLSKCTKDRWIVSIERVYTSSTIYMKSAVQQSCVPFTFLQLMTLGSQLQTLGVLLILGTLFQTLGTQFQTLGEPSPVPLSTAQISQIRSITLQANNMDYPSSLSGPVATIILLFNGRGEGFHVIFLSTLNMILGKKRKNENIIM